MSLTALVDEDNSLRTGILSIIDSQIQIQPFCRGLVLTTWRILRCNPLGGSGYDPPVWPPPGFFAGSTSRRMK